MSNGYVYEGSMLGVEGESLSQALSDVTLVNLSPLAHAYPSSAIEDLTLHEQERGPEPG